MEGVNSTAQLMATAIYKGSINSRIIVQASPGMKRDPISKTTNTKRTGRMMAWQHRKLKT
jgi:hypothetical protein